ncbi:hypothetical protein KIN20_029321 [Parelaphostrongylus tenuis]|uniref:Uncharacterized protein n=1 Tax=Parelaphostrongylus tenuis TaxID=148309 RepID=A0AAD5R2C6_PARTN|nr:hypothetical protein KIN20_029321 [Parelaphostrongylus tenuis]
MRKDESKARSLETRRKRGREVTENGRKLLSSGVLHFNGAPLEKIQLERNEGEDHNMGEQLWKFAQIIGSKSTRTLKRWLN